MPLNTPSLDLPPMERLRQVIHLLRGPGGCPWDAEQTHESLIRHLIEESYEAAQAIRGGDPGEMLDELGDVLLQPILHAEIASETGQFDLDEIASHLCEKLIRRHPHVFGDAQAQTASEVLVQWDAVKARENADRSSDPNSDEPVEKPRSLLKSVKREGPALLVAAKIQRKVASVGFDWTELPPVLDKVREELVEVEHALASGVTADIASEIGDLLFAVVNLARKTGHEAELLLDAANQKFTKRFQYVEEEFHAKGRQLSDASLEEMDAAWERGKAREKGDR